MEDQQDRNSRRQALKKLAVLAAAPLLAACQSAGLIKGKEYLVKILVEQSTTKFSPGTLVIARGTRVSWQNVGVYPQTVTCDPRKVVEGVKPSLPGSAKPFDSGVLYPGQVFSYQFTVPGKYMYYSANREPVNTIGYIEVT